MNLPQAKYRDGREFYLVKSYHSELDAKIAIGELRDENACFGKKMMFIFSSKSSNIVFKYGVYEQAIYGQIRTQ